MSYKPSSCLYSYMSSLRSAVDETEAEVVLLLLVVHIKTSRDLIFKVFVDLAGVVLDLDLPHPGDAKQHVLIVDERLVPAVQGLVVVPFCPVEAVQQWSLGVLFSERVESV